MRTLLEYRLKVQGIGSNAKLLSETAACERLIEFTAKHKQGVEKLTKMLAELYEENLRRTRLN